MRYSQSSTHPGSSTSFSFRNVTPDDTKPYIMRVVVKPSTAESMRSTIKRRIWIPGMRLRHKIKYVVLTTEWLPQLQTSCGYESFTWVLEITWKSNQKSKCLMCKQPCSVHLTPQYAENPQNICKGVFTNALQSCSKELSCF